MIAMENVYELDYAELPTEGIYSELKFDQYDVEKPFKFPIRNTVNFTIPPEHLPENQRKTRYSSISALTVLIFAINVVTTTTVIYLFNHFTDSCEEINSNNRNDTIEIMSPGFLSGNVKLSGLLEENQVLRRENIDLKCRLFGNTSLLRNNSCYFRIDENLDWYSGEDRCQRAGGHLADPSGIVSEMQSVTGDYDSWLGVFRFAGSGGTWFTAAGANITESARGWPWYVGEPNDRHGAEDCVALGNNGSLFDLDCRVRLRPLCQVPVA